MIGSNSPGEKANGRPLRAIAYARYSTDEQNVSSTDHQLMKIRRHLEESGFKDIEIDEVRDEGITGIRKSRPGIDHVKKLIESGQFDLVIAEESSRYYRNLEFNRNLMALAIDNGVRYLTITDQLDTNNENTRIIASIQGIIAEEFVKQTAARIRRSVEGRWYSGFVVNPLLPGYRRIASHPEVEDPRKRGPYRDEKLDKWTRVIQEGFERAARGDSFREIAEFFDRSAFPRPLQSKAPRWTVNQARRLIQSSLYKGEEIYRRMQSRASQLSGETKQFPSKEEEILRRRMPHLAHVSESLWNRANRKIEKRRTRRHQTAGNDHPTTGIPRDRWGPLSNLMYCGACGSRFHRDGAGYRCSASKARWSLAQGEKGRCWNRCSPQPGMVHANIGAGLMDALIQNVGKFELIQETVHRQLRDGDGSRHRILSGLTQELNARSKTLDKLKAAFKDAPDVASIVELMRGCEREIENLKEQITELQQATTMEIPFPSAVQVSAEIEALKPIFLESMGREAGAILRRLTDRIVARPYQSIDSGRIVLRAEFGLNLVKMLPIKWQLFLNPTDGNGKAVDLGGIEKIPMQIDLFNRPPYVRHAAEVIALRNQGLTLQQVCERLSIKRDVAKHASKLALVLQSRGLTEPYVALDDVPQVPSGRWRL